MCATHAFIPVYTREITDLAFSSEPYTYPHTHTHTHARAGAGADADADAGTGRFIKTHTHVCECTWWRISPTHKHTRTHT
jgi:hypothetical protein